jgi:hypothetical protein
MKLYSTVCWGLLVVFVCNAEKPATISDFCQQTKIIRLDRAEIDRMTEDSLRQIDRHNQRWKKHCTKRERDK